MTTIQLACPSCYNYTTLDSSQSEFQCAHCGAKLQRVDSLTFTQAECESGCLAFTGGEVRHDGNCSYYAESLTKMYANLQSEIEGLRKHKEAYTIAHLQLGNIVRMECPLCSEKIQKVLGEVLVRAGIVAADDPIANKPGDKK